MIKYLFILVNAFTVFLFSLFGGDNGITVSGNIPKTITAGQEVPIELKVTKGSMSGFAKLQLELPEGLSLKEGDNRGANFSFADGVAKWVWASLPTESDIIVKATLVASSAASGAKTIGAKYSYVENNAKQVVEMTPIEITIEAGSGNTTAANTNNVTTTPTETTATTNNNNTSTTSTPTNTESTTSSNKEPAGKVTVIRTITKGASDAEYIVNLKVQKGATRGFARYSDDLPAGLTAKAISTDGSSFSVADGKVKFVWVSVLLKDELELSYSLTAKTSVYATLKGEYSYLEDNQSKKYVLPSEQLAITISEGVANTTPTTTTEPTNTNTVATTPTVAVTTPTVAVTTPTEAVTTTTTAAVTPTENVAVTTPTETPSNTNNNTTTNNNTNTVIENTTKQEGNVNYMVQIGAFTNGNVTASVLKRQFHISENIKSELQGGFSKFMVGSHSEYKGARDQRERIRDNNGIKGAFVVAYNQSKRITVQEALMISNQKWYK